MFVVLLLTITFTQIYIYMPLPWATSNVYGEILVVMKDNTWLLGDNSHLSLTDVIGCVGRLCEVTSSNSNEIGIWGLIC